MTISRRTFNLLLGGAAAGGVLAPSFLPRLMQHGAAQDFAPPRFLAVRTPHGVDRDRWIPRAPGGAEPPSTDMDLMDLAFEGEDAILTPLTPWRPQITVLDGLDTQVCKEGTRGDRRTFHGHNEQGCMLTGAQPPADRESANFDNHPSLDFYLHGRLGAPVLLTASVEGTGSWKCMSYDESGRNRDPESNPRTLFRSAFPADFMPPTPGVDFSAGERRIFEHDLAQLRGLRDRLSGVERARIERHIAAMERLMPGPGGPILGACTVSGSDGPTIDGNIRSVDDVTAVTRAHSRTIAQAFACGRSRVATLQILNDYPNWYSDLPEVRTPAIVARYGGTTFRFHENLVHDYWGATGSDRLELQHGYCAGLRWSATQMANVLEELDAVPDPLDPRGGSILDNTIVFFHNEFGHDGHDAQETRHPAIIAGGGGRVLKLGRYLRLRNIASSERVPHNRLLTSIAQAVGLSDVDYFGDRDLASRANYQGPLEPLMV
jgi:hypothetical protein